MPTEPVAEHDPIRQALVDVLAELRVETWGHGSSIRQEAEILAANAAASSDRRMALIAAVRRAEEALNG